MGKSTTGEKPKFDLITASKTKKYKIITAVVLLIGILILGGGWLMRGMVTSSVTPNDLSIVEGTLSNLNAGECIIAQDESFVISTGTLAGRPLSDPIVFTLDNGARQFVEIWDSNFRPVETSHYAGLFWLHIKDNAPTEVADIYGEMVPPSGNLIITCGNFVKKIKLTYKKPASAE